MRIMDQSATIEKILSSSDEHKFKSIEVSKEVEPNIDVGNLLIHDLQSVDIKELKSNKDLLLNILARDNAQLLFNKLWELPMEPVEDVIIAKLPAPTTILPREKKIPKPKPPTKWEIFAKRKGISNKKHDRMIWDDESKTWKPRYGYKRGNDGTQEWCIEVPENSDPNENQFEKKENEKKERSAKNEFQRLRNIKKNMKDGITKVPSKPEQKQEKERLTKEISMAKVSTASLGKFQEKLPKEKESKKLGKKRKFESVTGDSTFERERAIDVWNKINKPPSIDVTKGVNKHMANEQKVASQAKKKSGKVKNKRFRKGAQSAFDKKKRSKTLGKGKTLGKRK